MSEQRIWQNRRSEGDFWFPLLFCYQDRVGKQVGAQLRYCQEKIMPLQRDGMEICTAELTLEKKKSVDKNKLFKFAAARYGEGSQIRGKAERKLFCCCCLCV